MPEISRFLGIVIKMFFDGPILLSHRTLNGRPQHPVGRASIGEGFPCSAMIMEPHHFCPVSFLTGWQLFPMVT